MSPPAWIFALALAASIYVYFGYPLLLLVLARVRPRPVRRDRVYPRISVIIAAYDEAEVIAAKIRDTLDNGYPAERLEVIVASDGSTDATVPIARGFEHPRVRVLDLPRRGKLPTLNRAVQEAIGDLLVFTDADTLLAPGALIYLAENFADPVVGGVAGRKVTAADASGHVTRGEGLYARYDEWQKGLESTFGSAVASHGALHALRRSLYVPVTDPTAADDMAISMQVVLQGWRLVYDPRAVVYVEAPTGAGIEFHRKVRIANQVMRALLGLGKSLWTSGFYSVQLLSHKLLRYLVPIFLMLLLASNAWLAAVGESPYWDLLLWLQGGFYGAALLGAALRSSGANIRALSVPFYFCLINAAAMLAVVSVLRGERAAKWSPRGGLNPDPR